MIALLQNKVSNRYSQASWAKPITSPSLSCLATRSSMRSSRLVYPSLSKLSILCACLTTVFRPTHAWSTSFSSKVLSVTWKHFKPTSFCSLTNCTKRWLTAYQPKQSSATRMPPSDNNLSRWLAGPLSANRWIKRLVIGSPGTLELWMMQPTLITRYNISTTRSPQALLGSCNTSLALICWYRERQRLMSPSWQHWCPGIRSSWSSPAHSNCGRSESMWAGSNWDDSSLSSMRKSRPGTRTICQVCIRRTFTRKGPSRALQQKLCWSPCCVYLPTKQMESRTLRNSVTIWRACSQPSTNKDPTVRSWCVNLSLSVTATVYR